MSGTNGMQMSGQVPPIPQPPQAMPPEMQGGQMPVQMAQNPYEYGLPQTTQYVQQLGRLPQKR